MIPFIALDREYREIRREIDVAVSRVCRRGVHILGPEVREFEAEFAAYLGVKHVVTCGSGTAAIRLAVRAVGAKSVLTSSLTAYGTVCGILEAGAVPHFGDVGCRRQLILSGDCRGYDLLLPVHIYGNPCVSTDTLLARVIEDACQAVGSEMFTCGRWRKCGTIGRAGCFSFYPTKNLGCYGDGGAVATNDNALAEKIRSLRNYGEGKERHVAAIPHGTNSRLDEIQAAILRVKLKYLDWWNARRGEIAEAYLRKLKCVFEINLPRVDNSWTRPNWHLFAIRVLGGRRDALRERLARRGVSTGIHYPKPVYMHPAIFGHGCGLLAGARPGAEAICRETLSLPCHPWMRGGETSAVVSAIKDYFSKR